MVAGFEFPKKPKTFAMPPEQDIGFEDPKCVFPVLNVTGDQDELEALGSSEARFFDSPVEEDELPSEQGILGDELGFASR